MRYSTQQTVVQTLLEEFDTIFGITPNNKGQVDIDKYRTPLLGELPPRKHFLVRGNNPDLLLATPEELEYINNLPKSLNGLQESATAPKNSKKGERKPEVT